MSSPFLGEIRIVGFNFAPRGWATCDGQLLPINQNTALFSLLGTNFGGNGTSTFALPNMQGDVPIHWGQGPGLSDRLIGETGGSTSETLLVSEMPVHNHTISGSSATGTTASPAGAYPAVPNAAAKFQKLYSPSGTQVSMAPGAITQTGGGGRHNNLMPYEVLLFIIALQGIFPSR